MAAAAILSLHLYLPHTLPSYLQEALRNYVLADSGAQNQAETTVRLVVTHSNLKASFMDIRLDLHVSWAMPQGDGDMDGMGAGLWSSCCATRLERLCCGPTASLPSHLGRTSIRPCTTPTSPLHSTTCHR